MYIYDAILTYVVVLVITFLILVQIIKIKWWSSFALSSMIALLSLLAIFPLEDLSHEKMSRSLFAYFGAIMITPFIIFLYVLTKALPDFDEKSCIKNSIIT